jgi:PAS domain S-box-containing protein
VGSGYLMSEATDVTTPWFFDDGGNVGERMRGIDWSHTPVGDHRQWAPELKSTLRLLLASSRPMTLWWGAARVTFYNDAALPLLGAKHPEALGAAATDVWCAHWAKLALDDDVTSAPNRTAIQIDQSGELVEYQCTRVRLLDSAGAVGGVLCEFSCDVDARAATMKRRMALLDQVRRAGASQRTWSDIGRSLAVIEANPSGISFALLYSADLSGQGLTLVASVGIEAGHPAAPASMALDDSSFWPGAEVLRNRAPVRLTDFDVSSGLTTLRGLTGLHPAVVFVVPLERGDADGLLIVGFDAASVFEPEATQFVSLLASQISASLAHAILEINRSTFQALADTAPAAIFIKDRKGRYLFASPLMCKLLNVESPMGRTDDDILPAETAARIRAQDRQVMDGTESMQAEEHLDGRTFLLVRFPWRGPDGAALGLYGIAIDITERKHEEEALRRTAKKYRAIGESINYGVWVCDAAGRNIFASDSFLELTGLSQEECSNDGWSSVLHPDDAEPTMQAWQACVEGGVFWSREHRIRGVDGRYHFVLARGVPVRNDAGAIERWVGINLDIHQIKMAEQQLREADRRNDQFLAMLAHELRNPLVPIRNSLHLMHAAGLATSTQREAYDVMVRQVENLVRLVSDMLDLGRIAQRKLPLHPRRIGLNELLDAAIGSARPHIDESRYELVILLPDEPIWLTGDPDRLTQVISNLVINSATYAPPGGRIEVRARRAEDEVELTITDNGVTALPELQRSAEDTLAQYGAGMRFAEGAGIGLALVKDLVEMHGGTVVSRDPGAGESRTLNIRLPIAGPTDQTDSFSRVGSAM